MSTSKQRRIALAAAIAVPLAMLGVVVATAGSSDGPAAFLFQDKTSAVFVQWTRSGDDVSGTIAGAEVGQPQAGMFGAALRPAGEVQQHRSAFTGTVDGDSIRLQIGSGSGASRVNGRLDGNALELTLPGEGVQTVRLNPDSSPEDYSRAVAAIRSAETHRRQADQTRREGERRDAKPDVMRAATAFQNALRPGSGNDPCRYMASRLRSETVALARGYARNGISRAGRSCAEILRDNERDNPTPLYDGPQGVASIQFTEPVAITRQPAGAVVTWRPGSGRDSGSVSRTLFTKQDGRWLVFRLAV